MFFSQQLVATECSKLKICDGGVSKLGALPQMRLRLHEEA